MSTRAIRIVPLPAALCLACAVDHGFATGTEGATAQPSTTVTTTAESSSGEEGEGSGSAGSGDATTAASTEGGGIDTSGAPTTDDDGTDDTGGLPEGVVATGELFPADIIRVGDELMWANQMDGDCIRRIAVAGGTPSDVACEPSSSTLPLQVVEYDGRLAYSFMSTSGGASMGFGGVRLVDPEGGAPTTIDEGSRFKSSSSSPFCNDTLAASGSQLFWYAHELSEHSSSIVHYDGGSVVAFDADSPFPYGVVATPSTIYWSATEAFYAKSLGTLGAAPTPIGTTVGSSCGRTSAGETLYVASRGTFAEGPALFRFSDGLFSNVRDMPEVAYDLAVDDTHLYLAFETRVDRLPLADLAGGAAETIVEGPTIGGILRDADRLYWSDYWGGEVRYETL